MTAPVSILCRVPVREIAALFASLPRLTPEEAAAFSRDLASQRSKPSEFAPGGPFKASDNANRKD